jgi:non-heme Fe2+,alpha-ketoglutarate-dependent halogenase
MASPDPIAPESLRAPYPEIPRIDLPLDTMVRRLTSAEKYQYERDGYVKNLPLFDSSAVAQLQDQFEHCRGRLPDNIDINKINNWHKASRWLAALCQTDALLDYVEDILGPNFFHWAGQFFVKYPGDGSIVPWHQDAQYWPLSPFKTVTVWLAIYEADEVNGAMRIVKGSHQRGAFGHATNPDQHYVLDQEVSDDQFDDTDVATLDLKAGQISLHDSRLLHGSRPNNSDRVRCAFTIRYCASDVQCDLDTWPNFETYPGRGVDEFQFNPRGEFPRDEGFPTTRFQHSREFK